MSEDKTKTGTGSDTTEKTEPEVKDGKVVVDAEIFHAYKTDMHKYKEERNQLREQVAGLEKKINEFSDKDKKIKEDSLKEQQKFKELAELKEKELVDMKTLFNQQKIDSALKTKALQLGINDPNDIKLIDTSKVVFNENGEIDGVDEVLNNLKTAKPYLFKGTESPKVDTGKAGSIPADLTYKKLMENPQLATKVKSEKPELYALLKEKHLKGG